MDSIYNEIYGLYYFMLTKILEKAAENDITAKDINSIVTQYGYSESGLYFTPDVISQGGQGYNLLKESEGGYCSILESAPSDYVTNLQKSFIKSMITDKRIRLFLEEPMLEELSKALSDVEPLYTTNDIILKETAEDCDNYSDEKYIENFKTILESIRNDRAMRICFNTSRGERKTIKLAPYKLEYGIRDDKFRLCGVSIYNEKPKGFIKINLARILTITTLQQTFELDFETYVAAKRKPVPIEIEVYNLRNGFERVFIGLSNYERTSSFYEDTGRCNIKIHYTADDEQELLIQLLSFGPAIKVLGPADFKSKFVERIQKQYKMFNKDCL